MGAIDCLLYGSSFRAKPPMGTCVVPIRSLSSSSADGLLSALLRARTLVGDSAVPPTTGAHLGGIIVPSARRSGGSHRSFKTRLISAFTRSSKLACCGRLTVKTIG